MAVALRSVLPGAVIFTAALLAQEFLPSPPSTGLIEPDGGPMISARSPDPAVDPNFGSFVADLVAGEDPEAPDHPVLAGPPGPVYAALRADGVRLADGWGTGARRSDAVREAVAAALAALSTSTAAVDTVELSIGGPIEPVEDPAEDGRLTNVHRGVLGLEVTLNGRAVRFAPTEMIANNLSFQTALGRAAAMLDASAMPNVESLEVGTFAADQVLVNVEARAVRWLFRGNEIVAPETVSAASTEALASSLGDWLTRNVHPDGRMTYKYWPSRGEESAANNTIRQWMATVALGRVAKARGDAALDDLVRRNIEYNLATFYEEDGELGLIVESDGDVKLGAVALAALALIEHPDRAAFADEEAALRRTVDALWNADGSFRTFHRPQGRNDNQNFYPGEALLLWATLFDDDLDADLGDRFMRSFRYYREWHRENRNPAFVPWHTQAYVAAWHHTKDGELRDFVFEMNDWLVDFQQWDDVEYPDLRGRFHDPANPAYGPPHSSSDGVYLEGLAAAYRLAVAVDDRERADRYRRAISRALRNVMQLQFADDVDLFYVSRPGPVADGIRTTPYDNEIRVDNVQHNLMGILDVVDTFAASDYSAR